MRILKKWEDKKERKELQKKRIYILFIISYDLLNVVENLFKYYISEFLV